MELCTSDVILLGMLHSDALIFGQTGKLGLKLYSFVQNPEHYYTIYWCDDMWYHHHTGDVAQQWDVGKSLWKQGKLHLDLRTGIPNRKWSTREGIHFFKNILVGSSIHHWIVYYPSVIDFQYGQACPVVKDCCNTKWRRGKLYMPPGVLVAKKGGGTNK